MKTPTISVIVPVYNVEKYLPRCIDSILNQTFSDFEILLIDDGSSDNSGNICNEYAKRDSRIKVFHKKNGGVSSARNLGLDNAKGKWTIFVDSDDWIEPDFFILDKYENSDIIQKSYKLITEDGSCKHRYVKDRTINNRNDLFNFFVQKRNNALWDKFISTDLIKHKRFNENIKIGEDFLFFLSLIGDVKTYSFCSTGCYNYIIRRNSAMQTINQKPHERLKILYENLYQVSRITSDQKLYNLGKCIIYETYINSIWSYRKIMGKQERFALNELFKKLKIKELIYTSRKTIIYLLIKKIIFLLHL